jgi:hypothetical protein
MRHSGELDPLHADEARQALAQPGILFQQQLQHLLEVGAQLVEGLGLGPVDI